MSGGIVPARIDFTDAAAPAAPEFGDVYHARGGAFGQARHVFLGGNGLPQRWAGRTRFTVLETGFGLGNNFLATWAAWRTSAAPGAVLHYLAVEKHPPRRDDLAHAHAASPEPRLAAALLEAWPPLTPDLHRLVFDGGRVRLLLAFGDVAQWLPQCVAAVDAFYLDGFAPARNPQMWEPGLLARLPRLAAEGATAATWSVAREVRDALAAAGFAVHKAPGFAGKREMTVAHFAPRFLPPRPPGRRSPAGLRRVAVVGAGLAGAAVAAALAQEGLAVEVFDRLGPAAGASGNPGGLLHGVLHADDGPHARWHRAAALDAARAAAPLLREGRVAGALGGLLRLEGRLDPAAMQALVAARGLPADYVQPLDAQAAGAIAGTPLRLPAWWYPQGGWLSPLDLVAAWLGAAGITPRWPQAVSALRRDEAGWSLLDGPAVVGRADAVVLANAADAARLAGRAWPLQRHRGQVSWWPAGAVDEWPSGQPRPRCPIAGAGYLLPLPDGRLLAGATSQPGDDDATLRDDDHRHNLRQLQALLGRPAEGDGRDAGGRVGWRALVPDRLPLVGPLPLQPPGREPLRRVARDPTLWTLCALGSRGLAQAPLAAAWLAAWMAGAPWPLGSGLADALDVARVERAP